MISNDILRQVERMIRPLRVRIANTVARAVVQLVDDSRKLQIIQIGALPGEDIDDGEHFQSFGFSSVPLEGAEAVALFPGGDRAHPLVIAVADRRHRPTGQAAGTVTVYSPSGARVTLAMDGDIEVVPGASGQVRLGGAAAAEPVALKSDVDALAEHVDTLLVGGTGSAALPPGSAPLAVGATKVRAE